MGFPCWQGMFCDNDTVLFSQGYGYAPFGTYTSPSGSVPTMGPDSHLHGTQQYQYPSPFYQPPASNNTLYLSNQVGPFQNEIPTSPTADKVPSAVGTATGNAGGLKMNMEEKEM